MARSSRHCQYQSYWDPEYFCRHRIEKDGKCIFHIRKYSEEEKKDLPGEEGALANETEKKCNREFNKLLRRLESDPNQTNCDFTGFSLPSINLTGSTFTKRINFLGATFHGETTFEGAIFNQGADFGRTIFHEKVNFTGVTFEQENRFEKAIFKRGTSFQKAVLGQTDFSGVTFEDETSFDSAKFSDETLFSGTTFNQLADFSNAIFSRARFYRSNFRQTANFTFTQFTQAADFLGAGFYKDAYFIGGHIHRCFEYKCDFRSLKLDKDTELIFERVSLENATLLDTNLEKIAFRDVDWYHTPEKFRFWMSRHQALGDEFDLLEGQEQSRAIYEKLSENYSQLVINYEQRRDFNSAENFHVGEMEMQRKKKGVGFTPFWWRKIREWANAYGVYRISSNYGTSYIQAFVIFVIMIILFSLFFLYSGFYTNVERGPGETRAIEYNLLPDSNHHLVSFGQWSNDFLSAVSLSLSIVTFQKERFYQPMEGISRFLLYLAIVTLTAQAALILLAIRRRFKR
jgi:uncharacterized protein YjbI with pentapeptide repeats